MSFFVAYYQLIQYPNLTEKFQDSFTYITLIEGAFDTSKLFFFISGFLQAFSFVQKFKTTPTLGNVFGFMLLRVLKVVPTFLFLLTLIIFA